MKAEKVKESGGSTVIEVPISEIPDNVPITRHLDARLPFEDAKVMRAVFEALHARHAKLNSGKHVDTPQQAVQWMLQEVGRQL